MAGKALEPSKLTGLMTAINDLTRGSPSLGKAVNPDHLKLLVMQAADDYAAAGQLDLQPLLDYLKEQSPPREEAEAILCAFVRRAQNLGVAVETPRALQTLTESERARLAEIALSRSQTAQKSGTFVGHAPTSRPGQVKVHAPPPASGTAAPPAAGAHGAEPAVPTPRPITARTRALIGLALVAAIGAALYFVAPMLGPNPHGDATKLFGPPGDGSRYTCDRVLVSEGTVVCMLTVPNPLPADHAAKLAAVSALGAKNGWPTVLFVDAATSRKLRIP